MAKGKYARWLTAEGLGCVEAWARDGLSDEQLAKQMGCSTSTLYEWFKKHPEISEAATRGRSGAREQIENALMKKALGYTADVLEPVKVRRRYWNVTTQHMEETEDVVMAVKQVHIPPDPRAAQFWLTNRNRDRWEEHPVPAGGGDEEKVTVVCDV